MKLVLDRIWEKFLISLLAFPAIESADRRNIAGIPFIYIKSAADLAPIEYEKIIIQASKDVIKGYQVRSETFFVRCHPPVYIFRHRFYVPSKKMFCCGNLCPDCTRFQKE